MNQEQEFELACLAYDAAAEQADEAYAVAMFCACSLTMEEKNKAIADIEARFDGAMRVARKALDVARFAWQA